MEGGGTAGPGITNVKKDLWFPVVSEGDWLLRQKKMIHNLTPEKNNTQFNEYPWVNKPCLAGAQNSQINPRVWWSPLAFHGGLGTRKSHKIECHPAWSGIKGARVGQSYRTCASGSHLHGRGPRSDFLIALCHLTDLGEPIAGQSEPGSHPRWCALYIPSPFHCTTGLSLDALFRY